MQFFKIFSYKNDIRKIKEYYKKLNDEELNKELERCELMLNTYESDLKNGRCYSSSEIKDNIRSMKTHIEIINNIKNMKKDENNWINNKFKKESYEMVTKPKPTETLPANMEWVWDSEAQQWIAVQKDNPNVTPATYNSNNTQSNSANYPSCQSFKSASIECLNKFLESDQYSREIKIESGLIEKGLIKYAGFEFNRGPKYTITEKGLNVLKQAAKKEYYTEKKSYLFSGRDNAKIQTGSDTSDGNMPKVSKKFRITESDGEELGIVEAESELDAKMKFFIDNPIYDNSQSIYIKEITAEYNQTTEKGLDYPNNSITKGQDTIVDTNGWVITSDIDESFKEKTLPVFTLLNKYIQQGRLQHSPEDPKDMSTSTLIGESHLINYLEHKVKDLGFYCESILQADNEGVQPTSALKIYWKIK